MRRPWIWTNFLNAILGIWLLTSPWTFGYRNAGMTWSDGVSGALICLFSLMALWPRLDTIGRWSACLVGIWLQFAPLVFWADTAAAYITDTLVGSLVIAFSILVPMMPGMAHHMEMEKPGPVVPPGWSYNPSSWPQRAPLILTAVAGWFVSRYLAAYQLGYIDRAWDPFFGDSTVRVLTSDVSRAWPISDAGLGAFAYTFEALMAFMGGPRRWRTMPWMVTFFGILVIPLGLVHITLVIMQPVMVGHWCTLCLLAAGIMLVMIPLAVDEVVAMCQFMVRSVREGKPFWRTFIVGGTFENEVNKDTRAPGYGAPVGALARAGIWGVSFPGTLVASAGLGAWLMFSPAVFSTTGLAADNAHVAGALVVTVSVIVMAEVLRPGRLLNALLGMWLIVGPWLLTGADLPARINSGVVGVALLILSLPLGPVRERYGGWDRAVSWPAAPDREVARGRRRSAAT